MYQKPKIICLKVSELGSYIAAAACSVYSCVDGDLFACSWAQFSPSCTFYDQNKCDPLSAPGGIHGLRNAK